MTDEHDGATRGAAQAYEPILAELISLYPRLMAAGGSPVKDGFHQVTHLAHGWYMRCHRGVQALLCLCEAGFAEEAAPIRRSIVEHAVALHWLVAEGAGILDTVARGHAAGGPRGVETPSKLRTGLPSGWRTSTRRSHPLSAICEIRRTTTCYTSPSAFGATATLTAWRSGYPRWPCAIPATSQLSRTWMRPNPSYSSGRAGRFGRFRSRPHGCPNLSSPSSIFS